MKLTKPPKEKKTPKKKQPAKKAKAAKKELEEDAPKRKKARRGDK